MACGQKQEKTIEYQNPQTGEKSEVKISKDIFSKDIKIQSEDGKASVNLEEGKMPSQMPEFIKPYPNGKDLKSIHAKDLENKGQAKKGEAIMVNFTTKDEPQKIMDFYKDTLLKNGFVEKGNMNMGKLALVNYVNEAQKQAIQIIATNEDGKATNCQIIFEKGE